MAQPVHEFCSDEATASHDDDLHDYSPGNTLPEAGTLTLSGLKVLRPLAFQSRHHSAF
jgi:hypothetical protein